MMENNVSLIIIIGVLSLIVSGILIVLIVWFISRFVKSRNYKSLIGYILSGILGGVMGYLLILFGRNFHDIFQMRIFIILGVVFAILAFRKFALRA